MSIFVVVLLAAQVSFAQTAYKITVKDETTKDPIAGVRSD